jgi:uncharacterized protein YdiU (UPF0061 family)
MAPGLDPARARLVEALIDYGWLDDRRPEPQSDSAQAFARYVFEQRATLAPWEVEHFAALAGIVLDHNPDPHDTDLAGTVLAVMEFYKDKLSG